ncbi:RrF2 family transcriptional regulator [Parasphingorhabdus cellanae]|uniref:Rrf2 family transcriptional regulator n=1 Tax=Parasphingorhabdus cellanae TaxID=2806553 RepID=A0ABX7SZ86_9SPHN|nr:Rrf2 family transcriptional regulator [Parasphingorhabdus cellanae]QTD54565.1 Rrf2 family transcriptional regulator [Parasphingorhabdus cellanae]
MRLTTQTDYALRTLMFLATQEESCTIDDIASAYGISKNHLMKVVQRLASAGFIISQRGRGGGLMLAHEAAEINIGTVVRAMEEFNQFVECSPGSTNHCVITPICGLSHMLADAVEAFLCHLDGFTLSDAIKQKKAFSDIFEAMAHTEKSAPAG